MRINKCMICGCQFESERYAQICSPECRKIRSANLKAEREENAKISRGYADYTGRCPSRIREINEEARADGMTYGKYMAMKYIENSRK